MSCLRTWSIAIGVAHVWRGEPAAIASTSHVFLCPATSSLLKSRLLEAGKMAKLMSPEEIKAKALAKAIRKLRRDEYRLSQMVALQNNFRSVC
jgi:hypothetical protein